MRSKIWVRLCPYHRTSAHTDYYKHQEKVEAEADLKRAREEVEAEGAGERPGCMPCIKPRTKRYNTRGCRALLVAGGGAEGRCVVFYNKNTGELVMVRQPANYAIIMTPVGAGVTSRSPFCHQIPSLDKPTFDQVGQTLVLNNDYDVDVSVNDVLARVNAAGDAALEAFAAGVSLPPPLDLSGTGGVCVPRAHPFSSLPHPYCSGRYFPQPEARPIAEQAKSAKQKGASRRGAQGGAAALDKGVGAAASALTA